MKETERNAMTKISEAIQFANDRPTSLNDDLYQWAVDAEEIIRKQEKLLQEALKALDIAFSSEHDAFGKFHNDATDTFCAIEMHLK